MTGTAYVVGLPVEQRQRLVRVLAPDVAVEEATAGAAITAGSVVVTTAAALASVPSPPGGRTLVVVFGDPTPATMAPGVAHVVRPEIGDGDLGLLVRSLVFRRPAVGPTTTSAQPPADTYQAQQTQRAFALSRRLAAAHDLAGLEQAATSAFTELVAADRVTCLFFDGSDGTLWTDESQSAAAADDDESRRAIAGVVGFAALTGQTVRVDTLRDDPRHLDALDAPDGDPRDRLLIAPVHGNDGQVHAVLVAARTWRRDAFTDTDTAIAAAFAALSGPFLSQLAAQLEAKAMLEPADDGLFRREAMDAQSLPPWGDVIRVTPSWLGWTYWALLALLAASVAYVSIGTISTYSSGPAIVRASNRADVSALSAGIVGAVVARPGDTVARGDVIARLDDAEQRGNVERIAREFETQLRNHMTDPADAAADAAVRALRLELDRAQLALDSRVVRAPAAGTIADLRVRAGLRVEPGDIVATIADGSQGLELVALLPGSLRPQLATGMPVRFEVQGYRYAYHTVFIESISLDVIAPGEARRVLGPEVADGLRLTGPVVLVRGDLPDDEFDLDGRTYQLHDGMRGTADVRVRRERIIYALVPGLRGLW